MGAGPRGGVGVSTRGPHGVIGVHSRNGWVSPFTTGACLPDTAYFAGFVLEGGTVAWPNGADIAPETLHALANSDRAA